MKYTPTLKKYKPSNKMEKELKEMQQIEDILISYMQMEKRIPKGFFKNKLKEEILKLKKALRELEEKTNTKHLFIKL